MMSQLTGMMVLVGAGKMGGAMLAGWLKSGIPAANIVVLDPSPPPEMQEMLKQNGIQQNPAIASLTHVEALVVAVKPQIMDEVLSKISPLKASKPLILSIVAGKTIAAFEHHFGSDASVIRTMPNTPAAIGRGITAMAPNKHVSPLQLQLARDLLAATGEVIEVEDEGQIDAVTAVSGSGPAYIFYLTECLAAAAEKAGLPPQIAVSLARATVAGSGELMRQSGLPADTLRKNVTSPNGTTYAALQVLMADDGLAPLMEKAVAAAANRSRELSK
jgi:pyrroline-5-carboxylate reductase